MTYHGFLFSFEKNWNHNTGVGFYQDYWAVSIILSIVYVLGIFLGQMWMQNRTEYQLKRILICWNVLAAAFSVFGTIRFAPHFFGTLFNHGLIHSVCTMDDKQHATSFWICIFGYSKVAELGDTVFLVLRKRKVIFSHWYHHVTVLIYTWHAIGVITGSGRWFVMMNYTVHSLMYTYFALSASGWRIPRCIRMGITICQLTQMVLGICVSSLVFWRQVRGQFCDATYSNTYMALAMYISYLALFGHFFYTAYVEPRLKRTTYDMKQK